MLSIWQIGLKGIVAEVPTEFFAQEMCASLGKMSEGKLCRSAGT
jgi:hypothetical protein